MIELRAKDVRDAIEAELAGQVEALQGAGHAPTLGVIRVGDNPESASYVRGKLKTAERLGIASVNRELPAEISQAELEAEVRALNEDPAVHGILCQLPLPEHLDEARITHLIDPLKDVDCFHPFNFGLLAQGQPRFRPCTPAGILTLLERYGIEVQGRHAVVLGRSNIVGRPVSLLLSQRGCDATVTVCHSRTRDLPGVLRSGDILVVAMGRPGFVTADMVREGAVVVDVGINRVEDASRERGYRLVGDVDYEAVAPRVEAITPVPGGVGPMTVVMLMENTLRAARLQAGLAGDAA